MRLQVHVYLAHAAPTAQALCNFLEIASPTLTLEDLSISICKRYSRLYPHRPVLQIHKLQDSECNDLDLAYTVSDVFSDKSANKNDSVVRVIQISSLRESSIPPESALRSGTWSRRRVSSLRASNMDTLAEHSPSERSFKRQRLEDLDIVDDSLDERDEITNNPCEERWLGGDDGGTESAGAEVHDDSAVENSFQRVYSPELGERMSRIATRLSDTADLEITGTSRIFPSHDPFEPQIKNEFDSSSPSSSMVRESVFLSPPPTQQNDNSSIESAASGTGSVRPRCRPSPIATSAIRSRTRSNPATNMRTPRENGLRQRKSIFDIPSTDEDAVDFEGSTIRSSGRSLRSKKSINSPVDPQSPSTQLAHESSQGIDEGHNQNAEMRKLVAQKAAGDRIGREQIEGKKVEADIAAEIEKKRAEAKETRQRAAEAAEKREEVERGRQEKVERERLAREEELLIREKAEETRQSRENEERLSLEKKKEETRRKIELDRDAAKEEQKARETDKKRKAEATERKKAARKEKLQKALEEKKQEAEKLRKLEEKKAKERKELEEKEEERQLKEEASKAAKLEPTATKKRARESDDNETSPIPNGANKKRWKQSSAEREDQTNHTPSVERDMGPPPVPNSAMKRSNLKRDSSQDPGSDKKKYSVSFSDDVSSIQVPDSSAPDVISTPTPSTRPMLKQTPIVCPVPKAPISEATTANGKMRPKTITPIRPPRFSIPISERKQSNPLERPPGSETDSDSGSGSEFSESESESESGSESGSGSDSGSDSDSENQASSNGSRLNRSPNLVETSKPKQADKITQIKTPEKHPVPETAAESVGAGVGSASSVAKISKQVASVQTTTLSKNIEELNSSGSESELHTSGSESSDESDSGGEDIISKGAASALNSLFGKSEPPISTNIRSKVVSPATFKTTPKLSTLERLEDRDMSFDVRDIHPPSSQRVVQASQTNRPTGSVQSDDGSSTDEDSSESDSNSSESEFDSDLGSDNKKGVKRDVKTKSKVLSRGVIPDHKKAGPIKKKAMGATMGFSRRFLGKDN